MSKIPIDKNLRSRESRFYSIVSPITNSQSNAKKDSYQNNIEQQIKHKEEEKPKSEEKCNEKKVFSSIIPKLKNMEDALKQNPRILDLRLKLDEITKKRDKKVDKETKCLINGLTQQLSEDSDKEGSGPYSLLFDLQSDPSTSFDAKNEKNLSSSNILRQENKDASFNRIPDNNQNSSNESLNKIIAKLPNVVHIEDKPLREFEYSCETELPNHHFKSFPKHSRSDLSLNFEFHKYSKPLEYHKSPNENTSSRANDENSLDDSLGILTPDQMDDICYLDNAFSPTVEALPVFDGTSNVSPDIGDTPSTEKTDSHSAASAIQNETHENKDNNTTDICLVPSLLVSEEQNQFVSDIETVSRTHDEPEKNNARLIEDEFMPSTYSSIIEPASNVPNDGAHLDLPLNCKCDDSHPSPRLEQTPSPEELPLDSDVNGEMSTYSNSHYSISQDLQTLSDAKIDFQKSMDTSKVSNSFITSITSITSLDGYQGDGEMSRPVSRGADLGIPEEVMEMDWKNVPVTRRADPMTDSDFFTESDADGLDDQMQRGDRRAQVIDGALYGGKNVNGNPLIVNRSEDSCMESSGVYTDFETHRASPVFMNVINDMSPEGSTPSTRSDCSQKNLRDSVDNILGFNPTSTETLVGKPSTILEESDKSKNSSKRNSLNSERDSKMIGKLPKEEKRFTLKKYKMPKRDVPSKLKSMLTRKSETEPNIHPKVAKKNDRRENLSKKSSIEKNDYKTKSYKDVKSKVDSSLSLQRSLTTCSVSRMLSSKSTANNNKPKSRHMRMRAELGSANGSGKSSLHSSQSDISAASTPLGKIASTRPPLLRNGKKREAVTPSTPARAPPTPLPPNNQAKKNGVVQKLSSSPVSVRARVTPLPPPASPRKNTPRRVPAPRPNTLPTNNKEPPRVQAAVVRAKKPQSSPQPVREVPPAPPAAFPAPGHTATLAHAAKGVEALGVLVQYLMFKLDALNSDTWRQEAERWRGVAATERSNAARADQDRQQRAQKDLDTIAECLSKISELEIEVSNKEEATARLQATHVEEITALAEDVKGLKKTIESLKHEVTESRTRLYAQCEIEKSLRTELDATRDELKKQSMKKTGDRSAKFDNICDKHDAACDPVFYEYDWENRLKTNKDELSTDVNELSAEVRSLRAVVELKQAEVASLRGAQSELVLEREKRAAAERDVLAARHASEELRERAAARQRDVDHLRDENRKLREIAARDRDHATRMAALNEELRYKLRQKSQVVSLLAGGNYIDRNGCRARTASCDSARSPSPESPRTATSPAPPAVKGVVEKHDSVSWVLEIEETPEEVASRLARRSSFRTSSSPSGVKRRGGGSPPAPASPSPNASKLFRPGDLDFPPPPLKESAGEAIYIYDDRQY